MVSADAISGNCGISTLSLSFLYSLSLHYYVYTCIREGPLLREENESTPEAITKLLFRYFPSRQKHRLAAMNVAMVKRFLCVYHYIAS